MISCVSRSFLIAFLALLSAGITAQETSLVWQPDFALNYKLDHNWGLNFKTSYRSTLATSIRNPDIKVSSEFFDVAVNASRDLGFYSDVGFGVLYRFNELVIEESFNEFRLTEQYVYARRINTWRILNRFRADQRITDPFTVFRFRYMISTDFPINGTKLDANELYIVISTESLLSIGSKIQPLWDQRLTSGLGYQLTEKMKLQGTLEFRWEGYNRITRRRFFVYTSLIYSL